MHRRLCLNNHPCRFLPSVSAPQGQEWVVLLPVNPTAWTLGCLWGPAPTCTASHPLTYCALGEAELPIVERMPKVHTRSLFRQNSKLLQTVATLEAPADGTACDTEGQAGRGHEGCLLCRCRPSATMQAIRPWQVTQFKLDIA